MAATTFWMLIVLTTSGPVTIPHQFPTEDACFEAFNGTTGSNRHVRFRASIDDKDGTAWCMPIKK